MYPHCLNQLMTFSFSTTKLASLAVFFALVIGVAASWAQIMQQDEKPEPPPKNVALEYPIGELEAMSLDQLNAELEQLLPDFRKSLKACLLYTSPSPRDRTRSRMPSSA